MDIIKKIYTVDKITTWYSGMSFVSESGKSILLDPDVGIFINGDPIVPGGGGGSSITVDEVLITGLGKQITMNTASGLVFYLESGGVENINSFGDFGARLDATSTLQIGNSTLSKELLETLQSTLNPVTKSIVLPANASLSIGDQTISRPSILYVNNTLGTLDTRLTSAEITLNTLTPLPGIVTNNGIRIVELETRVTDSESLVNTNRSKISTLELTTGSLGTSLGNLSTRQDTLTGTVDLLETKVTNLSTSVDVASSLAQGAVITSNEAVSVSQNAVTTSQNALLSAQNAVTTSQEAETKSQDALLEATDARLNSYVAVTKTQEAVDAAQAATTTAQTATATAQAATTAAQTATTTAQAATTAAQNADTKAQAALDGLVPLGGVLNSIADLQDEDIALSARVTALEHAGDNPDPIVLPYYLNETGIDFGAGKSKIAANSMSIGTGSITEGGMNTLTAIHNATEQEVDTQRVLLYTPTGGGVGENYGYSSRPLLDLVNPSWVLENSAEFNGTILKDGSLSIDNSVLNKENLDTLVNIHGAQNASFTPGAKFLDTTGGVFSKVSLPDYIDSTGLKFADISFGHNQAQVVKDIENIDEGDADSVVFFDSDERIFKYKTKPSWIVENQDPYIGNMGGTGGETEPYLSKNGLTFGNVPPTQNVNFTSFSSDGARVVDRTTGSDGQRNYFNYSKNGITLGNQMETPIVLDKAKLTTLEKIATALEGTSSSTKYMLANDKITGVFSYIKVPTTYAYLNDTSITMGENTGAPVVTNSSFTFKNVPNVNFTGSGLQVGGYTVTPNGGFGSSEISLKNTGLDMGTATLSVEDLRSLKTNFVGAADSASFPSAAFSLFSKSSGVNTWVPAPETLKWLKADRINAGELDITQQELTFTSGGFSTKTKATGFTVTSPGSTGNFMLNTLGLVSISSANPLFSGTKTLDHVGISMMDSLRTNLYPITEGADSQYDYTVTSKYSGTNGFSMKFSKPSEITPNCVIQPYRNSNSVLASQIYHTGIPPKPSVLDSSGLSFPSSGSILNPESTQAPHDDTTYNSNFARIGATLDCSILSKNSLSFTESGIGKVEMNTNGLRIGPTDGTNTVVQNSGVTIKSGSNSYTINRNVAKTMVELNTVLSSTTAEDYSFQRVGILVKNFVTDVYSLANAFRLVASTYSCVLKPDSISFLGTLSSMVKISSFGLGIVDSSGNPREFTWSDADIITNLRAPISKISNFTAGLLSFNPATRLFETIDNLFKAKYRYIVPNVTTYAEYSVTNNSNINNTVIANTVSGYAVVQITAGDGENIVLDFSTKGIKFNTWYGAIVHESNASFSGRRKAIFEFVANQGLQSPTLIGLKVDYLRVSHNTPSIGSGHNLEEGNWVFRVTTTRTVGTTLFTGYVVIKCLTTDATKV